MKTALLTSSAALAVRAFANAPKTTEAPAAAGAASKRTEPQLTAVFKLAVPAGKTTSNRGSKSPYPFDTIEVGEAFGVKNKTAKQLSSIVSNQNRKDANHRPVKDAAGNIVYKTNDITAPDGSVTKVPTKEPETEQIKAFVAYDVDADLKAQIKGTPLEGSSVLVFRTK
jgi:hypothetical protein